MITRQYTAFKCVLYEFKGRRYTTTHHLIIATPETYNKLMSIPQNTAETVHPPPPIKHTEVYQSGLVKKVGKNLNLKQHPDRSNIILHQTGEIPFFSRAIWRIHFPQYWLSMTQQVRESLTPHPSSPFFVLFTK